MDNGFEKILHNGNILNLLSIFLDLWNYLGCFNGILATFCHNIDKYLIL